MTMKDVIARLRADGDRGRGWFRAHESPAPLDPAALATLRASLADAAPDELFDWLAYDASWFPILDPADRTRLAATPLRALLTRWAAQDAGVIREDPDSPDATTTAVSNAWLSLLPDRAVADALVLELPMSGSQEHLLVLRPGATSRVLGFHQRYEFWWKYESFGEYLGHYFGFAKRD